MLAELRNRQTGFSTVNLKEKNLYTLKYPNSVRFGHRRKEFDCCTCKNKNTEISFLNLIYMTLTVLKNV